MTPKKEENINSLCKKYFTPELCDEPVTESKMSLKGKIYTQLLKLGDWICDKNFSRYGGSDAFCEIVISTIEDSWKKWEEESRKSYSAYFAVSVKNNVNSFLESKQGQINSTAVSLDTPIGTDGNRTLLDKIEEKMSIESEEEKKEIARENMKKVEDYLKAVDSWFKIRTRQDWNKSFVTAELYAGLHQYFDYYQDKKITRFSFIDEKIYNLPQEPMNKELAIIIGKSETQLTHKRKEFREQVGYLFNSSQE